LAAPDLIRLYHGTDWQSAQRIASFGLNANQAAQYNTSGEFWATTDEVIAGWFAQVNPAGGTPAKLEFEVSKELLAELLSEVPPAALRHSSATYEFLPASFRRLNLHMVNIEVHYLP
jgi:hypothetical protein